MIKMNGHAVGKRSPYLKNGFVTGTDRPQVIALVGIFFIDLSKQTNTPL